MTDVFFFTGSSGSGKTTVLEGLVAELTRRGLRVGALKHGPPDFRMDVEGKDTWRLAEAGCLEVAIEGGGRVGLTVGKREDVHPLDIVREHFGDMDIVIVEGWKRLPYEKVEVVRATHSPEPMLGPDEGVIAYVTDIDSLPGTCFALDDFAGLADFLEKLCKERDSSWPSVTTLTRGDGTEVEINDFVVATLARTTRALVDHLRRMVPRGAIRVEVEEGHEPRSTFFSEGKKVPAKAFIGAMVASTLRGLLVTLKDGPGPKEAFVVEVAAQDVIRFSPLP